MGVFLTLFGGLVVLLAALFVAAPFIATNQPDSFELGWYAGPMIGGGVFMAIGLALAYWGLIEGGWVRTASQRWIATRQQQYPAEPWRWRQEWATGVILSDSRSIMLMWWAIAGFWNLVAIPNTVWPLREALAEGRYVALIMLFLPVIGIGLVWHAARTSLTHWRFGRGALTMTTIPVPIGGVLEGMIRLGTAKVPADGYRVRLACIRRTVQHHHRETKVHYQTKWQWTVTIPPTAVLRTTFGQTVPVRVDVPDHQPGTDDSDPLATIVWQLAITADLPGADLNQTFEIPVYDLRSGTKEPDEAAT
jgi:hypothetical protein